MAKKTSKDEDVGESSLATLASDLMKEFKDDSIVCTLDSGLMPGEVPYSIPTSSTLLNAAIGGKCNGIPGGRVVELHGKSSTGKSAIAYDIIAHAQKMGGVGLYIDTEGSAERSFASILGVDPRRLVATQAKTVEELYDKAMRFIEKAREKFGPDVPIVVIGDSVTPPTNDEYEKTMGENSKIADNAKTQRKALRKLVNIVADQKAVFIGINHLVSTAGSQYIKETPTGGSGWDFFPSLRIKLSNPAKIEGEVKNSTIGIIVTAYIAKSKLDRPFRSCEVHLRYDFGIDDVTPTLDFVRKNSPLFGTSQGWYKIAGESYRERQIIDVMRNDKEAFEWLKAAATTMLQTGSYDGIPEYSGTKPEAGVVDLQVELEDVF